MNTQRIVLIGAGNMGKALLHAWADKGIKKNITILEKAPDPLLSTGWNIVSSLEDVSVTPDVVVLAVKPQSMDELLPTLAKKFNTKPLYISIAAGKTLSYFASHLGNAPIVRAMPNTPALIRQGITALYANEQVSADQKKTAELLFQAAGEIVWLNDESQMNVVTAISGSGPAYVFLFMESLVAAGIAQGLSEEIAKKLALQTVVGSALLAKHNEIIPLTELRQNVTSKGGTTEAALKVLMKEDGLQHSIAEAVNAAIKRAKELN